MKSRSRICAQPCPLASGLNIGSAVKDLTRGECTANSIILQHDISRLNNDMEQELHGAANYAKRKYVKFLKANNKYLILKLLFLFVGPVGTSID